ncbi:hypothetical protein CWN80_00220 [Janibacter hoylei PVAS-1]|nr:hypothetical protein [Janibacter hoylei]RWU85459.1 hypothetical protein CWN80_00220 [Janibacter hoylei PVAS-1]
MTDHNADLETLADEILAAGEQQQTAPNAMERARTDGARMTSGMERGNGPTRYDPATFMDKPAKDSPRLEPSARRGSSSPSQYVMAPGISNLSHLVHEARRRPDDATLGETKAAATAWSDFVAAADEARAAVGDVPAAMRRAADERAAALADPGENPTVLPSVADARAHAEAVAGKALRHALDLRKAYDDVVLETAGERLAGLEKAVPQQAEAIVARVADLRAAVVALRAGVTTLTYAAGEERGLRPRSLPTAVRLEELDALEAEVRQLAAIAADPAEPAITPSLRERAYIHKQAQLAVGGITAATVELARIEKSEEYRHTQYTRGIPTHVLENAAEQAQYR